MSTNLGPVYEAASIKLRGKSHPDSAELRKLTEYLRKNVATFGMIPALVAFTGFDQSSIKRQLKGTARMSRELSDVLLATMDRRDADFIVEQLTDATRVRVRAELVSPRMNQLDLFGRLSGGRP